MGSTAAADRRARKLEISKW